jgi:hypothetical protein
MPCVVGDHRISCIKLPPGVQSRIRTVFDQKEYWCKMEKGLYEVLPDSTAIELEDGRLFRKDKTEFIETKGPITDSWKAIRTNKIFISLRLRGSVGE